MGNYFSGNKITTPDNTISSECNVDIFVNKKSITENVEFVEVNHNVSDMTEPEKGVQKLDDNKISSNDLKKTQQPDDVSLKPTVQSSSEPTPVPSSTLQPSSVVIQPPARQLEPTASLSQPATNSHPTTPPAQQPTTTMGGGGKVECNRHTLPNIKDDDVDAIVNSNGIQTFIQESGYKKRNRRRKNRNDPLTNVEVKQDNEL